MMTVEVTDNDGDNDITTTVIIITTTATTTINIHYRHHNVTHHHTYKCQQTIAVWTGVSCGTHRRRRRVAMIVGVGSAGRVIRDR